MKDILTELKNANEVLTEKVLNVQEIAYFYKGTYECCYCGLKIRSSDYTNFEDFKRDTEVHTHKCTFENLKKIGVDVSQFSRED
jgi:hypothetical protein